MGSLLLVRHATTAWSASGRNLGQRDDPPLSDAGRELAVAAGQTIAAELAELPHQPPRLVSSPALRCRETIAAIASALELPSGAVEIESGLLEIDYGAWDGLTAEACRRRDPQLRAAWEADPWLTRCPEGESGADVAARASGVFERLEKWLAGGRDRCAVVVAHNHVNRIRLCDLLAWPMRDYRRRLAQDPGGYSLITFGSDPAVVRRINAAPRAESATLG